MLHPRPRPAGRVVPAALAVSLALTAVMAAGLMALDRRSAAGPGRAESTRVGIGGRPIAVTATDRHVWVLDRPGRRIRALHPATLSAAGRGYRAPVPAAAVPVALDSAEGVVWAAYSHADDRRGWLVRVDSRRRRVVARALPFAPAGLTAADAGRVVLATGDGGVVEASMGTLRTLVAAASRGAAGARTGGGWVPPGRGAEGHRPLYVPGTPGAAPVHVSPSGAWVARACGPRLGWAPGPGGRLTCTAVQAEIVAPDRRGAWAVTGRRTLVRLDPHGKPTARWTLPLDPSAMTARDGRVWLVSERGFALRTGGPGGGEDR